MASEDDLASFCAVTGASAEQAKFFLESSGGAVDAAISAFYDHQEGGGARGGGDEGDNAGATAPLAGAGAGVAGGPRGAMTTFGAMSAEEEDDMEDEVQQRQPQPGGGASRGRGSSASRGGRAGGGGGGTGGGARIQTFGDLRSRGAGGEDDEDEDEDDGPNEYYTGGEKSGMMVQDPNRRRRGGEGGMPGPMDGERLFDLARQHGARAGAPGELEAVHGGGGQGGGGGAFTGQGQRLGGPGDTPSTGGSSGAAAAAPSRHQQPQQPQAAAAPRHVVHLYRNGFTVDNGPLRSYHDPANAPFLNSISRGEYPLELARANAAEEGEVDMVRVNDDYKPPPEPKYRAFQGSGRKLGSTPSEAPAAETPSAAPAAPPATGSLPSAETARASSQGLVVDESQPVTSVQLRLADGTRLVARFNHTHTVADIRRFIDAARPAPRGAGPAPYSLQTPGFPPVKLEDDSQTVEAAGLINAVVIQR